MNFDNLSKWCKENYSVPEDLHTPFVVSYQINIDGDDPDNFPESVSNIENPVRSMRLFISTKHLLSLASEHTKTIQADATYKLVWLSFPVLIIGISDMDKVFHPLGIALCKDEKSKDFEFIFNGLKIGIDRCFFKPLQHVDLLADASDSITNGFKRVFVDQETEYKRGYMRSYFYWLKINIYLCII
jgi:hypothetical protein